MKAIEKVDGGLRGSSGEVICGFPVHPAASVYPLMEGEDWNKTLASIRKDMKVQEPVVFHNGLLLDGRNRLRAVELIEKETGERVSWRKEEFNPDWGDVVDWIEKKNSFRRNLTVDQLAVIAVKLHAIREINAAAERKKQSQFGSQISQKDAPPPVTPNLGSPSDSGKADGSAPGSGGKTKIKLRNPTTAEIIAGKAGPSVKRHQIESVFKIMKALGHAPIEEIHLGKKTISEVAKTIPKPPKPELPLMEKVAKSWEGLKKQFAVADLPEVRRLLIKTIKAEQTTFDGKGGAK